MYRLLLTDATFKELDIPLTPTARRELDLSISRNTPLDPIPVWRDMILMGYEQYDLCMKYHRNCFWKEYNFVRKTNAIVWICREQLKRPDIIWPAKAWLIYRLYEAMRAEENREVARTQFQYKRLSPSRRTEILADTISESITILTKVGQEYNYCRDTIRRYAIFGRQLDQLEALIPGARIRILTGDLSVRIRHMYAIMKMPPEQLKQIIENPNCKKLIPPKDKLIQENKDPTPKRKKSIQITPGIKQMPAYDPDAELNGLNFTVGTWIKAVSRTSQKGDFSHASKACKSQLRSTLVRLKLETECLSRMLEENIYE